MVQRAEKSSVPICLNLDHGSSIEMCMKAIRLGFTSVMLDASASSYEENVRDTALICRLAHSVGVTVEAELGHIFSSDIGVGNGAVQETLDNFDSEEDVYTDPAVAKDFVEKQALTFLLSLLEQRTVYIRKSPSLTLTESVLSARALTSPSLCTAARV